VAGVSESCGHTVKAVTDAGVIMLQCTLPGGHKGKHYDAAFSISWKEAA
jgi:hypothetical protein